ncbi:hypothetical protein RY831_29395 [Noviherbaspirillum sp. CPCC 100848]|uniref:Radical SAM protein n=1 Tax=Noviherbaspirillum album TaxID=3080276 RepID=A0ABU6JII6_9BURK|nr:hypothetical protein [Noviherbaspirillum sp. CPCC 100848]MEC4723276.1 hypothetical protein [Noviherbaspirillum sp. CPCC 100848]
MSTNDTNRNISHLGIREGGGRIDRWAEWIADAISLPTLFCSPAELRRALRDAVTKHAHATSVSGCMILLFGSAARLEDARDLDLIVVDPGMPPDEHHYYCRHSTHELQIDLNVVSTEWLSTAWRDVEWGYWLAESFPLLRSDTKCEALWSRSVNLYWSRQGINLRRDYHQECVQRLISVNDAIDRDAYPLLSRLLAHESARALACALIDQYGERIFSHRSLLDEFRNAVQRSGLSPLMQTSYITALAPGGLEDTVKFLSLRRNISRLYRSEQFKKITGYSLSDSLKGRVHSLAMLVNGPTGSWMETQLKLLSADKWLPQPTRLFVTDDLLARIFKLHMENEPRAKVVRHAARIVPTMGNISGARWAQYENGRLKLIVNTGGCKTPSCHFCHLPSYGRSLPRGDFVATVDDALTRYKPDELALYNDGNLLNEREVPDETLLEVCRTISKYGIRRLIVESIPRFVTRRKIEAVVKESKVDELTVAMGFQSAGNFFSIPYFGRPDVDTLFDFAIEEIHAAGATVRLYLLWGFGPVPIETWEERLQTSLDWAIARGVKRISVCQYRPDALGIGDQSNNAHSNRIRELLAQLKDTRSAGIEVVDGGLRSCAN